jgi:hypothetical protein
MSVPSVFSIVLSNYNLIVFPLSGYGDLCTQTESEASFTRPSVSLMQSSVTSDLRGVEWLSLKEPRTLAFSISFYLASIRKDNVNFIFWGNEQKPERLLSIYQRSAC